MGSKLLLGVGGPLAPGLEPDDISGLKLWLKADSESYADNDAVGTATDRSGIGNNFTQATAGNKPTFKTGIVNGLPVYRFDGTDDFLTGPNLMSGATAGEVFVVVKLVNDPVLTDPKSGFWHFGGAGTENVHFPLSDGNVYDAWGTDTRKSTGNPTLSLASAFRLYNVSSASASWVSRVNGTQHFSTGTNTVAFNTAPKLGQSIHATAFHLDGDIAEVIIYDSVLSAGNRDSVEGYLANKYGLTVA